MLLIIIISAAFAIFFISADASWDNVLSHKRNNLVFEGRVQDYGAFALRKEHPRTMFYAILLSTAIAGSILLFSLHNSGSVKNLVPFVPIDQIDYIEIPPIDKVVQKQEEKIEQQSQSKASATAGSSANNTVEVVQEVTPTINPVTEPVGQGGNQPAGQPSEGGTGTGSETGGDGGSGGGETSFEIKDWAAVMPSFPGGEEAMMKYMLSKVRFSEWDKERSVNGTMHISFVVQTDGTITDIQMIRNIHNGEELSKKAMKAISEMPLWTPGSNGKTLVPVRYTMPISFKLKN